MALEREIAFFEKHRGEWLREHEGKYALVKGEALLGVFDTAENAMAEGARLLGLESFLVRPILEDEPDISIPALTLGLLDAGLPRTV